ncbi:MAG: type 1 glutamine amidotransferase [Candidatus Omnitrophica bacterium]|nr:type 1 glutamine amidotransferase [Candidatus Omnitrophota bacterium]
MARIGILIDEMFEDSEYEKPAAAFKEAGHELTHLGVEKKLVKGVKTGLPVKVEKKAGEVSAEDFDAIFIPGGYSPDHLRSHDEVVAFVKQFAGTDRPVFFICHGAQLLITAGVLRGRKVTGWKSIIQDIKNAGAEYLDREVVEDGNFISSRFPSDIPAFIKACLSKLKRGA